MRSTIAVASAVIGIGMILAPIAPAQQVQTADVVTFELFTAPDSVELKDGAAQQLAEAARRGRAPASCPLGRITMLVPKGDPLFQEALGAARRDEVLRALDRQGIDASRFFADFKMSGESEPGNDAQLEYLHDQTPPKIEVLWTPEKGSRVQAGTRITAKATASDDTSQFQSGVKTIDLTVQGGAHFGFHDYPQPPSACERSTPPRTLDGVYTVPANPPSIVRLHAIAKDFAGNEVDVWAEFPTQSNGPCGNGAWWVGSIRGIAKPGWGEQVKRSAESVRLCEGPLEPVGYLIKGQKHSITLFDAGSTITVVHSDVGDPCRISGQGTLPLQRTVGVISSTLEEIGRNGELRWSQPTYWLSPAHTGEYTYTTVCPDSTHGPQTNTHRVGPGGWGIAIGVDIYDPQTGNRKLEGGRMAGSFATPEGNTASWSLTRQGGAPLFPARANAR